MHFTKDPKQRSFSKHSPDSTGKATPPTAAAPTSQLTWFRIAAVGGARVTAAAPGPRAAAAATAAAATAAAATAAVAQAGPACQLRGRRRWRWRWRLRLLHCKTRSVNSGQGSRVGEEKPPPTFCWTFRLPFPTIQLIVDVQQPPLQLQLFFRMELLLRPDHLLRCERRSNRECGEGPGGGAGPGAGPRGKVGRDLGMGRGLAYLGASVTSSSDRPGRTSPVL